MNRTVSRLWLLTFLLLAVALCGHAQKSGGGAGSQGQQGGQGGQSVQGGGSGTGLQGLSFTPSQWPYMDLPNPKDPDFSFASRGRVVVCYRLAKGNSASQPFVLEPVDEDDVPYSGFERPCSDEDESSRAGGDLEGKRVCKAKADKDTKRWNPCTELRSDSPTLKANQILVVGIDISDLTEAGPDTKFEITGPNRNQLKLFNLNVTNQQGSPLNPAPVRASFPGAGGSGAGSGPAGSGGHYITDRTVVDASGNFATWNYIGTRAPIADRTAIKWRANHHYAKGDIVTDQTGRDYYRLSIDPKSHKKETDDSSSITDPFPQELTADRIIDGEVVWQEASQFDEPDYQAAPEDATIWEANHHGYNPGAVVCVARNKQDAAIKKIELMQIDDLLNKSNGQFSLLVVPATSQDPSAAANASSLTGTCREAIKFDNSRPKNERFHLHYYFAVKGGTSGPIPKDPFSVQYLPRVIYLPWPYLLPGDVIPTFNVNLVYTPPAPAAPWQGNTYYPVGSVVTPGTGNGHYYTALTGGFSDIEPHEPDFPQADPEKGRVTDGSLHWLDAGTSAPSIPSSPGTGGSPAAGGGGGGVQGPSQGGGQGGGQSGKAMLWMPLTHFSLGDTVTRPETGHYFVMVQSDSGFSGAVPTNSNGGLPRQDPFPPRASAPPSYIDNQIVWTLVSTQCTDCDWASGSSYNIDQRVMIGNATYIMTNSLNPSAQSGQNITFPNPANPATPFLETGIEWRFVPGAQSTKEWMPATQYSIGDAVCDPHNFNNGRCADNRTFIADRILSGKSGNQDPSQLQTSNPPATVQDGDLIWAVVPDGDRNPHTPWAPTTQYELNNYVRANNGLYYKVIRVIGGVSGNNPPPFPITEYCTVVDPVVKIKDDVNASGNFAEWQDLGTIRPREAGSCMEFLEAFKNRVTIPDWHQVHLNYPYVEKGAVIFEPGVEGGRYYEAIRPGTTGDVSPFSNITPSMLITWLDSGTTQPSSVASGPPADQTVSLINLTLPQTHTLSRFNISSGFVVSFVRPPIFSWVSPATSGVNLPASGITVPSSPTYTGTTAYYLPASEIETTAAPTMTNPNPTPQPIQTSVATTGATATSVTAEPNSGCTYGTAVLTDTAPGTYNGKPVYAVYECPLQTGKGSRPVDAVLTLTAYLWPVDAEGPWHWNIFKGQNIRDWAPAPTIGMSLNNLANSFFIGGSNEFGVRNLQLSYGYSFHNTPTRLAPAGAQQVWGGQGTAPTIATTSTFQGGWYLGATFNLSNFIQSLFPGGAAAK